METSISPICSGENLLENTQRVSVLVPTVKCIGPKETHFTDGDFIHKPRLIWNFRKWVM